MRYEIKRVNYSDKYYVKDILTDKSIVRVDSMAVAQDTVDYLNNAPIEFIQAFMDDNRAWTDKAFPGATAKGAMVHLGREVKEVIEAMEFKETFDAEGPAVMEFADCYLLLLNACSRYGLSFELLHRAAVNKMIINKKRTWGKVNEQGYSEHVEPIYKHYWNLCGSLYEAVIHYSDNNMSKIEYDVYSSMIGYYAESILNGVFVFNSIVYRLDWHIENYFILTVIKAVQ